MIGDNEVKDSRGVRLLSEISLQDTIFGTTYKTAWGAPSAVGHYHLCHRWPTQLPSPSASTIAIAVGHFRVLLPWHDETN
jgi:hypothetical protein